MQMQMLICEWDWIDYVNYNPNFEESLIIKRVYPDLKKFEDLKEGFRVGEKMILAIIKKMDELKKK